VTLFAAYQLFMDKLTSFLDGIRGMFAFFVEHPPLMFGAGVVVLILFVARASFGARTVVKDDLRAFTPSMRSEAKRLAGGRCEHSAFWFRCRTPGSHADHIFPWSRGGRTTMTNCQSLCAKHNLQKSAHLPGRFYIHRLEVRRLRYFPVGANRIVDWLSLA
jgi:hypothetical protein